MPDLPKPAYDRLRNDRLRGDSLRAGTPAQPHPDADLLTAFAEQALLVSERDAILEHLSLCGDCREIISLALPATDAAAAPVFVETGAETGAVHAVSSDAMAKRGTDAAPHARMRGWPSLRWAALAAGVIVAASVFPGSSRIAESARGSNCSWADSDHRIAVKRRRAVAGRSVFAHRAASCRTSKIPGAADRVPEEQNRSSGLASGISRDRHRAERT